MSTLSGRPANPTDPSGDESQSPTEQGLGLERHSSALGAERQSSAPGAERQSDADDGEAFRSPFAPKHGRRRMASGQDLNKDLDTASDATPLAPAGVPETEWPYSNARSNEQPSPPTAF